MRTTGLWGCSSIVAMGLLLAGSADAAMASQRVRSGACMREGWKLAGETPVRTGPRIPQPKKIRDVPTKYPELPPRTRAFAGGWMGEFLLSTQGRVLEVWTIQEVRFRPPFPPFNQAIVDAIKQWEFEPLMIEGRPVPVCTTVTVAIDWS